MARFAGHFYLDAGVSARKPGQDLRQKAGERLRIGYGNSKQFLARLNHYNISRDELETLLKELAGKDSL